MTVEYNSKVATASFSGFLKLLVRWKGSIYKLVWIDSIVYFCLYFLIAIIYHVVLQDEKQKRTFEMISDYCDQFSGMIPVGFVLGFFVTMVVERWWNQFNTIPWPANVALLVSANLQGQEDSSRLVRRTLLRYVSLGYVMTMTAVSSSVKKRFPTLSHLTEAGMMLPGEQEIIENLQIHYNKYYVPFVWASTLVVKSRRQGLIKDDFAVQTILDELNAYRILLQTLFNYDWVNVPLVYTQVVTVAVYLFFLACLMGRQSLEQSPSGGHGGDLLFPFFTFLQFFFYMGWLKVAEQLMNPFGDRDDDFEINGIIDSNLEVCYLIVDDMHQNIPDLTKDQFWDSTDFQLPYTEATIRYQRQAVLGSAADIYVPEDKQRFVSQMSVIAEESLMSTQSSAHRTQRTDGFRKRSASQRRESALD